MKLNAFLDDLTDQIIDDSSVPALIGESGIGKSSFLEAKAARHDTECFTVPVNQLAEKADLTGGRLVPNADQTDYRQAFFPHERIAESIDYATTNPQKTVYLFLDEINRAGADLTSAVLTLVTSRMIGRVHLPENLRIVVAGNDRGNISTLDDASISRFVLLPVEPDASTLLEILENKGTLNRWVKHVLSTHPKLVFCKATPTGSLADGQNDDDDDNVSVMQISDLDDADESMVQFTTPRTIEAVSKWLNRFTGYTTALYELLTDLVPDVCVMRAGTSDSEISQLQQILESFTGPTEFTAHLLSTIVNDISAGGSTSAPSGVTVPRPNSYAYLKQASTLTDLEQAVSMLSDDDKSACLLYALYEKADNNGVLLKLTEQMSSMDTASNRLLVQMVSENVAHKPNLETFLGLSTPMAQNYQAILSTIV